MSLFGLFDSLANGTFADDIVNGLEKSIETLEKFADSGASAVDTVASAASNTLDRVVDGAEKAANVADVVVDKLDTK